MIRWLLNYKRRFAASMLFSIISYFLASPSTGFASNQPDDNAVITGAEIVECGLYEADRLGRFYNENTSLGSTTALNAETIRLVQKTNRIPAEIGKHFGINYIVHGTPDDANVELIIRVITPGLTKPTEPGPQRYSPTGERLPSPFSTTARTVEQWPSHANIGKPAYDLFGFEYDWELVPGTWTFQIWHKDRMLAEKAFEVYPVAKKELTVNLSQPVRKVIEYMTSSDCADRLRAVYMIKVLGKEAAPALPYLIKNLENYSNENQIAFDCGSAKETPSAIAAIGNDAIEPLIEKLASELWQVQAGAKKSLLLIGNSSIDPLISTAKSNRNLDTRRYAVTLLGDFKDAQRIIPALTGLLSDYFPEIRYAALEDLLKLKDPASIIPAAKVFKNDKVVGIRSKAAEVLGCFKDRTAINPLIEAYQNRDEDWSVRLTALTLLVQNLDPAEVLPLVHNVRQERDPQIRKDILQAISARDDKNYLTILEYGLDDPDGSVREVALEGLIRNKDSSDVLRNALSHGDDKIRIPALFEMARRHDLSALKLLPDLLNDSNTHIRLDAAAILAKNKDARAFKTLMEIARLMEPNTRDTAVSQKTSRYSRLGTKGKEADYQSLAASAIRALGTLGDRRAFEIIIEATNNQNSYIADAALEALGMMPYPQSIGYLIEYMAQDRNSRLDHRYLARDSLVKIGEPSVEPLIESLRKNGGKRLQNITNEFRYIMGKIGKPSIPHLAGALRYANIDVKRNVIEALSQIKDPEAAKVLTGALYDQQLRWDAELSLKYIGTVAVNPLLPLMEEKDPEVRFVAIRVLGSLGVKKTLRPLLKALKDEKLLRQSIEPIGGIKDRRAMRALTPLLKHNNSNIRYEAAKALGPIGDQDAVIPLIELLESEQDHNVINATISSLGKLGAKKASQKIIPFLGHDYSQTRITAAEALLEIGAPDSVAALVDALDDHESIVRNYAYKALKKISKADCGFYSDAWRLWLERNEIPKAEYSEKITFFRRIYLKVVDLLWDIWVWLTDPFYR